MNNRIAAFIFSVSLVLAFSQRSLAEEPVFDITAFVVEGNTLVDARMLERAAQAYAGPSRRFADIEKARFAVQELYVRRGYGAVQVLVPEQEIAGGMVRLRVVEARIGKVEVKGNRHFSTENIRRSLPELREGHSPNTVALSKELALANENPAKQAVVTLGAGEKPGEIAAKVTIEDEKPWKVTLKADNTGNEQTGQTRTSVSYRHANVLNRDHQAVVHYTTSPERPDAVSAVGAQYRIPIYETGDTVQLSAGYSNVNAGTVAGMEMKGRGSSAGARYIHPLSPEGPYTHSVMVGADIRHHRSGLGQGDANVLNTELKTRPVSVAYSGQWQTQAHEGGLSLSVSRNLPGASKGQAADFEANRSGANPDYTVLRYDAWYRHRFAGDWSATVRLSGQETGDVLVPVEYMAIGGIDSVRGFYERQIGGDTGMWGSLEVSTPNWAPAVGLSGSSLRFVWFVDGGQVTRKNPLPGEKAQISVLSTGLGMRYHFAQTGLLRLDAARVLEGDGVQPNGHHRAHGSLIWGF
jgi:hemolysin activation/secretion protein